MKYTFRPLPVWPHKPTSPRTEAQFKRRTGTNYSRERIPFGETMELLEREVWMLNGDEIVIGVGLAEYDIRQDGQPRANARAMSHPGVEISFNSQHGRLNYATDEFTTWQDNVRAVALALEALRKVERYGVSKRGQQYAGFALLAAGPSLETRGAQLVEEYGSIKKALQAVHPDTGSAKHTQSDYQAVLAFRAAQGPSEVPA